MTGELGIVVFGDVIASRRTGTESSAWLRSLRATLDQRYGGDRLAPFGFTQGDELQGLLRVEADPLRAMLIASLEPNRRPMRWAIVSGEVEPGPGPATERTGPAFLAARDALERQKVTREGLAVVTGDARADEILAEIAPVFARLLDELTPRQRVVAREILVEGRRQADVAARLEVSRATISVVAHRARVREIASLGRAIRRLMSDARTGPAGEAELAAAHA